MRAVIYARYSSDNQREASIEDQVRLARAHIESRGWTYLHAYNDPAISGASALRPGYQRLLADARAGQFDVVVAEALDRLSRDQEDVAALYKRLSFAGIRIVTLAGGACRAGCARDARREVSVTATRWSVRPIVGASRSVVGVGSTRSRPPSARHGHSQQRAVHRPAGLEPATLRRGIASWTCATCAIGTG